MASKQLMRKLKKDAINIIKKLREDGIEVVKAFWYDISQMSEGEYRFFIITPFEDQQKFRDIKRQIMTPFNSILLGGTPLNPDDEFAKQIVNNEFENFEIKI